MFPSLSCLYRTNPLILSLEHTNFFLLHLCVFREYLDLEFRTLAHSLPFAYNLEHIIDDFILLCVFVGNDFLPNLPDLHIHANALEKLFDIYKETLPKAGVCSPYDRRKTWLAADKLSI